MSVALSAGRELVKVGPAVSAVVNEERLCCLFRHKNYHLNHQMLLHQSLNSIPLMTQDHSLDL